MGCSSSTESKKTAKRIPGQKNLTRARMTEKKSKGRSGVTVRTSRKRRGVAAEKAVKADNISSDEKGSKSNISKGGSKNNYVTTRAINRKKKSRSTDLLAIKQTTTSVTPLTPAGDTSPMTDSKSANSATANNIVKPKEELKVTKKVSSKHNQTETKFTQTSTPRCSSSSKSSSNTNALRISDQLAKLPRHKENPSDGFHRKEPRNVHKPSTSDKYATTSFSVDHEQQPATKDKVQQQSNSKGLLSYKRAVKAQTEQKSKEPSVTLEQPPTDPKAQQQSFDSKVQTPVGPQIKKSPATDHHSVPSRIAEVDPRLKLITKRNIDGRLEIKQQQILDRKNISKRIKMSSRTSSQNSMQVANLEQPVPLKNQGSPHYRSSAANQNPWQITQNHGYSNPPIPNGQEVICSPPTVSNLRTSFSSSTLSQASSYSEKIRKNVIYRKAEKYQSPPSVNIPPRSFQTPPIAYSQSSRDGTFQYPFTSPAQAPPLPYTQSNQGLPFHHPNSKRASPPIYYEQNKVASPQYPQPNLGPPFQRTMTTQQLSPPIQYSQPSQEQSFQYSPRSRNPPLQRFMPDYKLPSHQLDTGPPRYVAPNQPVPSSQQYAPNQGPFYDVQNKQNSSRKEVVERSNYSPHVFPLDPPKQVYREGEIMMPNAGELSRCPILTATHRSITVVKPYMPGNSDFGHHQEEIPVAETFASSQSLCKTCKHPLADHDSHKESTDDE